MNITKKILIFYFIVLVCLSISFMGAFFLNERIAIMYIGISYTIIPLITIISIIYSLSKNKS